jgi:molecular chaperone DnaJ
MSLVVAIPAAVDDRQVLRLKGDGDAGPRNGPRGDLLLRITVEPDAVLRRSGIDILMDLPISAEDAAAGCSIEVPTLRGPKRLRIPARTQDHTLLRIGGAGLRPPGSWHKGDQFVTVRVQPGRPTADDE